ncbi:hypothetical protein [Cohaesibacter sp. ES.047]|uniref:hypothetical protein n=1 Tax=Cohaesibacter sp. ES.047 TaxID=1798205 RepID=UPI0012FD87C2|nr:hypothetical protein [Cohaesibacter sp. ES.047]
MKIAEWSEKLMEMSPEVWLTKLRFLDRMVWLYDDMRPQNLDYATSMKTKDEPL